MPDGQSDVEQSEAIDAVWRRHFPREGAVRLDRPCWCGNADLAAFSDDYRLCPRCQTLVTRVPPAQAEPRVHNDEQDFYGRQYWLEHQKSDLGFVNIAERARMDLAERCLWWLRGLLKYKLPPARVLELGSAHGGFVAMLRRAGFEAMGLELSPWVVDFARRTFGVPMLLGPIEDQQLEAGSLDAIALMDVLEHLPDPIGTMRACLNLLKPEGILLIQTPSYQEGRTHAQMLAEHDRFVEQFKSDEHLNLFSRSSVTELFHRLGVEHLAFEPAIFSHYDMFLAVSRQPMATHSSAEVEAALQQSADGRFVQAMVDLEKQQRELDAQFRQADADRQQRLATMEAQGQQIAQLSEESARRVEAELHLADMQAQRDSVQKQLEDRERQRAQTERQREEAERKAQDLESRLKAKEAALERSESRLDRARWIAEDQKRQLRIQGERLAQAHRGVGAIRSSPIYRAMNKVGSWSWLEEVFDKAFPDFQRDGQRSAGPRRMRVAIDLTPVLPGGENGGAKLVVIGLIKQLKRLAPEWDFILLTSGKSHDELAYLDGPNVWRECVIFQNEMKQGQAKPINGPINGLKMRVGEQLARVLPPQMFDRLRHWDTKVSNGVSGTSMLRSRGVDLYFCAFGAPNYYDPAVPVVSVIYDLQYAYYPQFFPPRELYYRDKHFQDAARVASRLICISDYVRGTVIEEGKLPPERVVTSHIRLWKRIDKPTADQAEAVWRRLGLVRNQYLFFPANFWAHKNHAMLLTAFAIYLKQHPDSTLKLVLTGAPGERMEFFRDQVVARMGLGERVVFPGFLPDEEFAALLEGCRAMIFPSLYEGFGMPVLEAMQFGKPVLCSNVTSLPEVAGDAALLFDPRKPGEIVSAIERIVADDQLAKELVEKGFQRVRSFGSEEQMAREYLQAFREAIGSRGPFINRIEGLYLDHWSKDRLLITYEQGPEGRELELAVAAPPLPQGNTVVKLLHDGEGAADSYVLEGGIGTRIRRPLSSAGGFIEVQVEPLFRPKDVVAGSDDERAMGVMCQRCRIIYPEELFPDEPAAIDLLVQEADE